MKDDNVRELANIIDRDVDDFYANIIFKSTGYSLKSAMTKFYVDFEKGVSYDSLIDTLKILNTCLVECYFCAELSDYTYITIASLISKLKMRILHQLF